MLVIAVLVMMDNQQLSDWRSLLYILPPDRVALIALAIVAAIAVGSNL